MKFLLLLSLGMLVSGMGCAKNAPINSMTPKSYSLVYNVEGHDILRCKGGSTTPTYAAPAQDGPGDFRIHVEKPARVSDCQILDADEVANILYNDQRMLTGAK